MRLATALPIRQRPLRERLGLGLPEASRRPPRAPSLRGRWS